MRFKKANRQVLFLYLSALFVFAPGYFFGQDISQINVAGTIAKHPKVSFDGQQMVFIANYDGRFKPYISDFENGAWKLPQLLFGSEINGMFEFKYPQLNFDNSVVYFSGKTQSKIDYDVYFSEKKNGTWTTPQLLPIDIHSNVDELSPVFSTNEKKMLFTRPLPEDAKADDYCQQIFSVERLETGVWSEPVQLSPSYNNGCVCSPYYSTDNKTFFYSSYEDVLDAGGSKLSRKQFNIFWAKIDESTQYTSKPILSFIGEEDLVSFSIQNDSIAYFGAGDIFTSNPKKLSSSIRSVVLPATFLAEKTTQIKGKVSDLSNAPVQAIVKIIDPYTSKVYQQVTCDVDGSYQAFLPSESQYSILATKESYSIQSKLIETNKPEDQLDFQLFKEVGITFNVFDEEFFFPIGTKVILYDSVFNKQREVDITVGEQIDVSLGKELNIVFHTENYQDDTLNLPLHKEVIFTQFDFDIELKRLLKQVDFSFSDDSSGEKIALELTVYNVSRNVRTKRRVKDGKVSLELRDGEVYEISTSAQGYSYYTSELDLSKEQPKAISAKLQSVKDQAIELNNIVFEISSFNLDALSYVELNRLVTYLKNNETLNVEISAHTDSSGGEDFNLKLSSLRANSVANYLQDNAIIKDRLVANGYGESLPKYPNNSRENMAKNRRVEFKILNSTQ